MWVWGDGAPNLEGPVDYIERIADMGACAPAMAWLRSEQYPTLQAAWDACPRGDWLLWVLLKRADDLYQMARFGCISDIDVYALYGAAYAAARDAADACAAARDADAVRTVIPVAPTLP